MLVRFAQHFVNCSVSGTVLSLFLCLGLALKFEGGFNVGIASENLLFSANEKCFRNS